jgi:L-threonylcarbamoyladenylate synthase
VALRVPAHHLALELLRMLPFPLAAPSANPFGYISPVTAEHVFDQLEGKIPYILDGGACAIGLESTVVTFEKEKVVVLRLGGISVEEIEAVAGKVRLEINQSSDPRSPGQLKSHYAPKHPLILGRISKNIAKHKNKKIAVLSLEKHFDEVPAAQQIQLSPTGDLTEAARNLFASLRQLDALDIDVILAEELPEFELGRAVNDRLRRAAAEEK